MLMADERREKMNLTKDAFARAAGRKGSAYQPWMKCEETLKTESDSYNELRKITDQLKAAAQRVVALDPSAPKAQRLIGLAEVTSQLDWIVGNALVELPKPLWIALKYAHRTAHLEAALLGSERPADLYPEITEVPKDVLQAVEQSRQDQAVP